MRAWQWWKERNAGRKHLRFRLALDAVVVALGLYFVYTRQQQAAFVMLSLGVGLSLLYARSDMRHAATRRARRNPTA